MARLWSIDVWRVAAGNQCVGVCGVADDKYANVAIRVIVDGLALYREDRSVGLQQVLALHAGAARACTYQQCVVAVFEGNVRIVGCDESGQRPERTIVEFHDDTLESIQCLRYLEQLQDHRLVIAEHLPGSNAKSELIADLAGSPGDRYANG
jgi:hypothetical protein